MKDAHRVIGHLIQPAVRLLPPETIAVFLQAAMKVFGHWAAEVAAEWNDDAHLAPARRTVDELVAALEPFAANEDVEVQERAANLGALLVFVKADLAAHKPQPAAAPAPRPTELDPDAYGFAEPEAEPEPEQDVSLHFPKSLLLLHPLFSTPELAPVAPSAQASVPRPTGIDLDAWIVPPPAPSKTASDSDGETVLRKNGKNKGKGKEKAVDGEPTKRKKKKRDAVTDAASSEAQETAETPEERAERERVRALSPAVSAGHS